MKKTVRYSILMVLIFGMLLASITVAQAATIQPRYIVIRSLQATLSISEQGRASCVGQVYVTSGYTADLTVELKQDGTTIMTWKNSGSGRFSAGGTYYVKSGHTFVVTVTAVVYDSNGHIVERESHPSLEKFY